MRVRSRYRILDLVQSLDPERDHERIVRLSGLWDFPWDGARALELALFRTFAVPSIGGLLYRTGEFTKRAQKRYDDTELLIAEFIEHGWSSERGARAIARMNAIHSRYRIGNDDFLYVLSTFVFEPSRWNARFGWRPLSAVERRAGYVFWREVGTRMGIAGIPETAAELEAFNVAYEREHFRYSAKNAAVARATIELFCSWYLPRPLWPLGERAVCALL
ncbi:MAG TPA: oxygenase MpaB family protein, partial [Egibacteraceae bacterium]|nr:oxygenase MpaB family protein [Egibacteraceae bacterium]